MEQIYSFCITALPELWEKHLLLFQGFKGLAAGLGKGPAYGITASEIPRQINGAHAKTKR